MDHSLFEFFNQTIANGFLDGLLPTWRTKETWIPLYLVVVGWMLYKDTKKGMLAFMAVIIAVGLADFITSGILKPWVGRLRPCADPDLADQVRLLVSCGGKFSFPSSHASNHIAIALVLNWCWFQHQRWIKIAWLAWAVSIALAQIYVGKHFPLDILGGWVVGILTAILGYSIFRKLSAIKSR
ncbi:MAG: phosphatase PAP2 family protein [Bacteroidota bacterium]